MHRNILCLALIAFYILIAEAQEIDTMELNTFFNSLEKRKEAMASISLVIDGKILYQKAIGHRSIENGVVYAADTETCYRIWSITKTYTATMVMQMIEEGALTLQTTLDYFYPKIPNSKLISIQDMLNHRSGIHDFIEDSLPGEDLSSAEIVNRIEQYEPDFTPKANFSYSNSNYLLLGYIIERIDETPYEISLANRVLNRIGAAHTFFDAEKLAGIEKKALSYQYLGEWQEFDEGGFGGAIPAGAGGIVATTADMALFIESLFSGKLITQNSLNQMLDMDGMYGLGVMKTHGDEIMQGFGHTGGYIASESSLFHYPEEGITIAYATNGIVLRKEEIIQNVLRIVQGRPFAISMNRGRQALFFLALGLLLWLVLRVTPPSILRSNSVRVWGLAIFLLFWVGQFIAGLMHDDFSHTSNDITRLQSFYSVSGTFMISVQLTISLLCLPLLRSLMLVCKRRGYKILPVIPIIAIPISMIGSALFPFPHSLFGIFANIIILIVLGPLLAVILWRINSLLSIRKLSALSLLLILTAIGAILCRPLVPELVHTNLGAVQGLLNLGWTSWIVFLSLHFQRSIAG